MSAVVQARRPARRSLGLDKFFLWLAVIYLLIPLAAIAVWATCPCAASRQLPPGCRYCHAHAYRSCKGLIHLHQLQTNE